MPLDLTGIQNVGEFYSHHYLDALLENDLKGLFAQWREEEEDTPYKRLNGLATAFYQAKQAALRARTDEARYKASHAFHVELLEALGYEYHFDVRYLLEGEAVPILGAATRDGGETIWLVETPFAEEEDSPLEQAVTIAPALLSMLVMISILFALSSVTNICLPCRETRTGRSVFLSHGLSLAVR